MSPTVLVVGAGHETALGLMRALEGETLTLLGCDANPKAAGLRLLPKDRRFVVHGSDSHEMVGDLLALCVREHVSLLVATDMRDVPALSCARQLFEQLGTRVWLDPARHASGSRSVSARKVVHACQPSVVSRALGTLTSQATRIWRSIAPAGEA